MANLIARSQASNSNPIAATDKLCAVCGHSIPAAAHFCPDCGKAQ
jgi:predicted amidophosphoribosyltransferase